MAVDVKYLVEVRTGPELSPEDHAAMFGELASNVVRFRRVAEATDAELDAAIALADEAVNIQEPLRDALIALGRLEDAIQNSKASIVALLKR